MPIGAPIDTTMALPGIGKQSVSQSVSNNYENPSSTLS